MLSFPGGTSGKEPACQRRECLRAVAFIPGSERSPGEGSGSPLQYSCLGNPVDREAWRATVHRVTESDRTEATAHSTQKEKADAAGEVSIARGASADNHRAFTTGPSLLGGHTPAPAGSLPRGQARSGWPPVRCASPVWLPAKSSRKILFSR